ncbi:MAG TPA: response regulator [Rhodocyclaceae bacterium]|nr:response regulator [Rhodocyclaceae bacterium]
MSGSAPMPLRDGAERVYVVDDDLSVREAVCSLIRSVGLRVETFPSAAAFLAAPRDDGPACLILDVRMPGLSGLELQTELHRRGTSLPIIFVTGHGDIPMAVHTIKKGAVEFLSKPFRDEDLLAAIDVALAQARSACSAGRELGEIRRRYAQLTAREKEVIAFMVKGALNKQAAAELGVSEMTVKVHRRNVMHKMGVARLPDLVRMMERLHGAGG